MIQRLRTPVAGLLKSKLPVRGSCTHNGSQGRSRVPAAGFPIDTGSLSSGAFHSSSSVWSIVPSSRFPSAVTLHELNEPLGLSERRLITPVSTDTENRSLKSGAKTGVREKTMSWPFGGHAIQKIVPARNEVSCR